MDIEPGISEDYLPMDPKRLLQRLHTALNSRDLENLVRCFQVDYESVELAHPGSEFTGLSKLGEYWEQVFRDVPDFQAGLLDYTIEADMIWSEWHWHGGQEGDQAMDRVGVIIFRVEDGLIASGRQYMEDVRPSGAGSVGGDKEP